MLWDLAKGFMLTKEQSQQDLALTYVAVLGTRVEGPSVLFVIFGME